MTVNGVSCFFFSFLLFGCGCAVFLAKCFDFVLREKQSTWLAALCVCVPRARTRAKTESNEGTPSKGIKRETPPRESKGDPLKPAREEGEGSLRLVLRYHVAALLDREEG